MSSANVSLILFQLGNGSSKEMQSSRGSFWVLPQLEATGTRPESEAAEEDESAHGPAAVARNFPAVADGCHSPQSLLFALSAKRSISRPFCPIHTTRSQTERATGAGVTATPDSAISPGQRYSHRHEMRT
jgi:hypothetical protein